MHGHVDDVALPVAALDVTRAVDIGLALVVGYEKGIIDPVHIAESRRPLAAAVGVPASVAEVVYIVVLQAVIDITNYPPVHQVLGLHDRGARTEIHGRAHHVVGIPHPYHVIVGDVRPSQRIDTQCSTMLRRTTGQENDGRQEAQENSSAHI